MFESAASLLVLMLTLAQSAAVTDRGLEQELRTLYGGKVRTVREFPEGDRIRFDSGGQRLSGELGIWTLHGTIHIESVRVNSKKVELRGSRVIASFNDLTGMFDRLKTSDTITLEFPRDGSRPIKDRIDRAFIPDAELPAHLPHYWQRFLSSGRVDSSDKTPLLDPVSGELVSYGAPGSTRIVHQVTPKLTNEARSYKPGSNFHGHTELRIIINELGVARVLDVIKPSGFGLDEQAVEAIKQWRFEPPMVNGKPSKILVVVEVNFQVRR